MSILDSDAGNIAVIGLSCNFPKAPNPGGFWKNLADGTCCISEFSEDELSKAGISPHLVKSPDYVRVAGVLEDIELFDARFFGITPGEAELMDPQHRILMEVVWQALENAGRTDSGSLAATGLFAGLGTNTYLLRHLLPNWDGMAGDAYNINLLLASEKDFAPSRISYRLNMHGPSMAVQTACSTGLVTVHEACRSLIAGDCDVAVAAAASVRVPHSSGYLYRDGSIFSRSGRCRAFDRDADGCVPGNGAGAVVLRRLEDAVADGDTILAVVLGTAINNDGARKVGYAAPSVEGQAEVIRVAHAVAGVSPEEITYVEAHGTGTLLGDPVECAALKMAFGPMGPDRAGTCLIGSVKANIGHLDAAAGLAGFIKVVLALHYRKIPPSINYSSLNPEIDFSGSPFAVNTGLCRWTSPDGPRTAGVSSFGVGGTNAHAVLREAPPPANRPKEERIIRAFPLAAPDDGRLRASAAALAEHLGAHPNLAPGDVSFTLRHGRWHGQSRMVALAADTDELAGLLRQFAAAADQDCHGRRLVGEGTDPTALRWLAGEDGAWGTGHGITPPPRRVALPGIVFHRERHWFSGGQSGTGRAGAPTALPFDKWFVAQCWSRAPLPPPVNGAKELASAWVVFTDGNTGDAIVAFLRSQSCSVLAVRPGSALAEDSETWTIAPGQPGHYRRLLARLAEDGHAGIRVVHAWSAEPPAQGDPIPGWSEFGEDLQSGFESLWLLAQAAAAQGSKPSVHVDVVSRARFRVARTDTVSPSRAALAGPALVMGQEVPWLRCRSIDLGPEYGVEGLFSELLRDGNDTVAFRWGVRWRQHMQSLADVATPEGDVLRRGGTYVLFGGFGGIGQSLARSLAEHYQARLVLVGRGRQMPPAADHGTAVRQARALEAAAARPRLIHDDPVLVRLLNGMCAASVVEYLAGLGLAVAPGTAVALAHIEQTVGIAPPLRRLLDFMQRMLVEDGLARVDGGQLVWLAESPADSREFRRRILEREPDLDGLLAFFDHCLAQYDKALSGAIPAISVLYPQGREDLINAAAVSMLARSTGALYCRVFAQWLAERAEATAPATLRVVEFGAGNLLLTRQVMAELAKRQISNVEYWITDIGTGFVAKASQVAAAEGWTGVRFAPLDISSDPTAQGFALHSVHVAVGLNVLHATRHLGESLGQIRKLLTPGGILGLVESVRRERWVDLVAGLAEGWWLFDDPYRSTSPLLEVDEWLAALADAGYTAEALPEGAERDVVDCAMMMAQAPGRDFNDAGLSQERRPFVADLRRLGADVLIADADVTVPEQVTTVLDNARAAFGRIDGIINVAGSISGGLLQNLTRRDLDIEFAARVRGSLNIARAASHTNVDFIALSSSLNAVVGGEGQLAYTAANAAVGGIAEADPTGRTVAVLWDRWKDVGLAKSFAATYRSVAGADLAGGMNEAEGFEAFRRIIASGHPQVAICTEPFQQRFSRYLPPAQAPAQPEATSVPSPDGTARTQWLAAELAAMAAGKLGCNTIGPRDRLMDAGADSIVILDLQATIEQTYGLRIAAQTLLTLTIEQIARACLSPEDNRATLEVVDASLLPDPSADTDMETEA